VQVRGRAQLADPHEQLAAPQHRAEVALVTTQPANEVGVKLSLAPGAPTFTSGVTPALTGESRELSPDL
jgi:hypothetical protein